MNADDKVGYTQILNDINNLFNTMMSGVKDSTNPPKFSNGAIPSWNHPLESKVTAQNYIKSDVPPHDNVVGAADLLRRLRAITAVLMGIRNYTSTKTTNCTRYNGSTYTTSESISGKALFKTTPTTDANSVPTSVSTLFDKFIVEDEKIEITKFNELIGLVTAAINNTIKESSASGKMESGPTYVECHSNSCYCHSSCHSSCHDSCHDSCHGNCNHRNSCYTCNHSRSWDNNANHNYGNNCQCDSGPDCPSSYEAGQSHTCYRCI